jgi:putative phosphoesterase
MRGDVVSWKENQTSVLLYHKEGIMRVAVLSDIHDNIWNLAKVLERTAEADILLFLGDFCAPFTLKQIADSFKGPIHCVRGNNDGDMLLLSRVAAQAGNVTFYSPLGELELEGRKVAITHYPEVAAGLAASNKYDAVFSGHTHEHREERLGGTLWANPGEVMGRFGEPGFGFYDPASNRFTREVI